MIEPALKSPFTTLSPSLAGASASAGASSVTPTPQIRPRTPAEKRREQLVFFEADLRSTVSKRGKPYAENSIISFLDAAKSLAWYLDEVDFQGELHEVTWRELNDYLATYRKANGQGGTVTKQGNIRTLFKWLTDTYDLNENQYEHRKRHVYRRDDVIPPSLSEEFYGDLLGTCIGSSFLDVRDAILLRIFMLGPRLGMVEAMRVEDIDIRERLIKMRPHKHSDNWTYMAIPDKLLKPLNRYLRARAELGHPAAHGDLWISGKRKQGMSKSGLSQVLKRRVKETGTYSPELVHAHLFRHTAAAQAKALGLTNEQMMQHFQWSDDSMPNRYGRDGAAQRSVDAFRAAGFGNR